MNLGQISESLPEVQKRFKMPSRIAVRLTGQIQPGVLPLLVRDPSVPALQTNAHSSIAQTRVLAHRGLASCRMKSTLADSKNGLGPQAQKGAQGPNCSVWSHVW